ncbi:MAG: dihydropteroate synthase [Candidatus Omnitrophota bacterium]|nr:dihydropteroate synthase [Candidatus Omnitrophota bacterium]
MTRILQTSGPREIIRIMQEIKVDAYGMRIMLPKAVSRLVRTDALPSFSANILKQEMLSLGGDAAISRNALTGKDRLSVCLLMGTLAQYQSLSQKLRQQPFGLAQLAEELRRALKNYAREKFILELGRHRLNLGRRTHIMGIVNLTPDSFSGDGLLQAQSVKRKAQSLILEYAEKLVRDGADIIDIGGESSRPGAKPVSAKEELKRVIPAIRIIAKKVRAPISIDTRKPEVARQALDNGAAMVNDITGLRYPEMIKAVKQNKAAVVIMHMKGNPRDMQVKPEYASLIDEIAGFLQGAIKRAEDSGINPDKIIVDPGIGFGKTLAHNLEILKRLGEFRSLGKPIMVGPSRKSFLGKILKCVPQERIFGTITSCILAAENGVKIVRAHDVKAVAEALKVFDAVNKAGRKQDVLI